MKRIALFVMLIAASGMAIGQKSKVISAGNHIKPEYNELDKAKEAIDLATVHEKTKDWYKTWYYRGLVYQKINDSKDKKYQNLCETPLIESYEAFKKAIELDTKGKVKDEILLRLTAVHPGFFNKGVQAFQKENYPIAVKYFKYAMQIDSMPFFSRVDTALIYNTAIAADNGGMYDEAISFYRRSIDLKYGGADVFALIANIHKHEGDTIKAIETIKEGIEYYPEDNINLINELINHYIKANESEKAIVYVQMALEKDPKNPQLHWVYGALLERLDGKIDDAEAAYKEAIALNPDYLEALYNLGVLYFNKGVEVDKNADTIRDNTEYANARKDAEVHYHAAIPYFEKAHDVDAKDKDVMISLKQTYYRLNMTEKYEEIDNKLKEL